MAWGGKREGAGRPKSSAMVSHLKRPRVGSKRPVKISLKLRSTSPILRDPQIYDVFEKACLRARRFGLRIIHYALLDRKILMICEFKKQESLEKSFKSLNTSLAIALKKRYLELHGEKHQGPVFLGRFHMELLSSADEVRLAIRDLYLSATWEDKVEAAPDPYSSAALVTQWSDVLREEFHESFNRVTFSADEKARAKRITALPQFWLTQSGWNS